MWPSAVSLHLPLLWPFVAVRLMPYSLSPARKLPSRYRRSSHLVAPSNESLNFDPTVLGIDSESTMNLVKRLGDCHVLDHRVLSEVYIMSNETPLFGQRGSTRSCQLTNYGILVFDSSTPNRAVIHLTCGNSMYALQGSLSLEEGICHLKIRVEDRGYQSTSRTTTSGTALLMRRRIDTWVCGETKVPRDRGSSPLSGNYAYTLKNFGNLVEDSIHWIIKGYRVSTYSSRQFNF